MGTRGRPPGRLQGQPEVTRLETSGSGADAFGATLGYWNIAMTGLDPRLLAETPDGFDVPRVGKYLGVLFFRPTPSGVGFGASGGPPGTR